MAYTEDKKATGLDLVTTIANNDVLVVGQVADGGNLKQIQWDETKLRIEEWMKSKGVELDAPNDNVHLRMVNGHAEILFEAHTIASFEEGGFRLTDGSYGQFPDPGPAVADPFQADSTFPDVTENTNPFAVNILSGVSSGGWTRSNFVPALPIPQQFALWPTTFGTSQIRFQISNPRLPTVIRFYFKFLSVVTNEEVYQLEDDNGNVLQTLTKAAGQNDFIEFTYDHTVTSDEHLSDAAYIILKAVSGPASNRMGLRDYGFTVLSNAPSKDVNTVGQFDSNNVGVLLPRISRIAGQTITPGTMALEASEGNRPMVGIGTDYNHFRTYREMIIYTADFFFFYGDFLDGSFDRQGWNFAGALTNQDVQGFKNAAHFTANGQSMTLRDSGDTALWNRFETRGFFTEFVCVPGAGRLQVNTEPVSWTTAGRFSINITEIDATTCYLEDEGSASQVVIPRDEVCTIRLVFDPIGFSTTQAKVYRNGIFQFDTPLGGYDGGRGLYIWSWDTPDNHLISMNLSSLEQTTRAITAEQIDSGVDILIPDSAFQQDFTLPTESTRINRKFAITNCSAYDSIVTGATGQQFVVQAGRRAVFQASTFPRGYNFTRIYSAA